MPKSGLRQEFELSTRSQYTKVDCEMSLSVNGKELPNLEVLGRVFEECLALVQTRVTESYKVVPERTIGAAPPATTPPANPSLTIPPLPTT